jgi:23S rRNA pseudouridine955/2504/2580 synthase
MPTVQHVTVSGGESGQKLLQFLQRRLGGGVPRSALMRWIRTGQVRVDSSRAKPFQRVYEGQRVRIPPHTPEAQEPLAGGGERNPFLLRTVHEDEELLVLAKPSNLASQLGTGLTDSVDSRLRQAYADAAWRPSLVHRLDRDTSGLLLAAKSYACLRYLQRLWRQGGVTKIYVAWVAGETAWNDWTELRDTLRVEPERGGSARKAEALSRVLTVAAGEGISLVGIRLDTGRKHQIRIQMARRGRPVMGDDKYGGPRSGQGLLLHACHLAWDGRAFTLLPPWTGAYAVTAEMLQPLLGPSG